MPAPAKKIWIRVRLSKRQIDALRDAVDDMSQENVNRLDDEPGRVYTKDEVRAIQRAENEAFAAHHALTRAYETRTWRAVVYGRGVTIDDLWRQCRGVFQRGLVCGDYRPSLAGLKGKACKYGSHYKRSMWNLFNRLDQAGIKTTYTKGPHGVVGLRFDRKRKVKKP